MQRLFFVRHGKTEYNLTNRVQGGDIDSPLLDFSKEEAVKTGIALREYGIHTVIASPQPRVVETARIITEQFDAPCRINYAEGFKEFGYGQWEGLYIPDLSQQYPELFYHLRNRPDLYDPSSIQGETYPQLVKRGTLTVKQAVTQFPDQDLLFVGHSITLMSTILSLIDKQVKDLRSYPPLENTSISLLHHHAGNYTLKAWNQTDHLL